jgi:alpha-ketoglutarate-dependent taurine dioxygenase
MTESLSPISEPRRVSRPATLRVERFSAHVGATVHGVDLSAVIPSATAEALRAALYEHGVLFFRDQQLSAVAVPRGDARVRRALSA